MKNWKKVMAMLCTAAMVTGFSAPVWAEEMCIRDRSYVKKTAKGFAADAGRI